MWKNTDGNEIKKYSKELIKLELSNHLRKFFKEAILTYSYLASKKSFRRRIFKIKDELANKNKEDDLLEEFLNKNKEFPNKKNYSVSS